jgi:hypothetical protein
LAPEYKQYPQKLKQPRLKKKLKQPEVTRTWGLGLQPKHEDQLWVGIGEANRGLAAGSQSMQIGCVSPCGQGRVEQ